MRHPDSPAANGRWLSTHEVAEVLGCHPQTVRDRCARGEVPFTLDPQTGHRRIPASALESLGYAVPTGPPARPARAASRAAFQASETAELAGVLSAGTAEHIATHVVAELAARDQTLTATAQRLGQTQAAVQALASARFWERPRLLAGLRAEG